MLQLRLTSYAAKSARLWMNLLVQKLPEKHGLNACTIYGITTWPYLHKKDEVYLSALIRIEQ